MPVYTLYLKKIRLLLCAALPTIMSHCLRQVSTLSRTPLQRSYDTLALASLRGKLITIGTIDVVIVTDLIRVISQ